MNWLITGVRQMVITHLFPPTHPPKNLTFLQVFVKRGGFNDIWLHKGNWSVWQKRIDCVTRKITFNMRQWGAVHVTYSLIFLLRFNLMRVYLGVFEGDSVREQKAQLCGVAEGSWGWYFPKLPQQSIMNAVTFYCLRKHLGTFKYFFRWCNYHKAIVFTSNFKLKN